MLFSPRRRDEEGQVYPALLLAVLGALALAVLFVVLQNLLDQTGRSDTAADAAALAAAEQHREQLTGVVTGEGLSLDTILGIIKGGFGEAPGAADAAEEYAQANGATVVDFRFEGSDLGEQSWTYYVKTQQNDGVEDASGNSTRTTSVARAKVSLEGGLCDGGTGILADGKCVDAATFLLDCVEPEPDPPPSEPADPKKGKKPSDGPSEPPEPEFTPAPFCGSLGDLLDFRVQLISAA